MTNVWQRALYNCEWGQNLSLNFLAAKTYNGEGQLSAEFSVGDQILPRIKVRKTGFKCTQISDSHLPRKKVL